MPHELTTQEKKIVEGRVTRVPIQSVSDETLPHPKKLHWWSKLGAQLTVVWQTLLRRKGGG